MLALRVELNLSRRALARLVRGAGVVLCAVGRVGVAAAELDGGGDVAGGHVTKVDVDAGCMERKITERELFELLRLQGTLQAHVQYKKLA